MSYAVPSAEVAADFKDALQDLKMNSRPEISNLTIIAKENTEHAQAISRELENHIRTTRPEYKLPALYVLDSIVKNVGTPYTVYLGRNLYRTFMDAYLVMDMPTRKAMEGLLKTWRQPVPESMDTRPVFAPEVTKEIETSLLKFKTVLQNQQQQTRVAKPPVNPLPPRPSVTVPWRNTPTPPQNASRYASNDPRVRQSTPQQYGFLNAQPTPPPQHQSSALPSSDSRSTVDVGKLNDDLDRLIITARSEFAVTPFDAAVQQRLKALLDLQSILKNQNLPPDQLKLIQDQVVQLTPATSQPPPQAPTPVPASLPFSLPTQPVPSVQPSATPLSQLLTQSAAAPTVPPPLPNNLANLLQNLPTPVQPAATPIPFQSAFQTPTPVPQAPPAPAQADLARLLQQFAPTLPAATPAPMVPAPVARPSVPVVPSAPPSTATPSAASLLDMLRAQGLLPNMPSTAAPPQAATPLFNALNSAATGLPTPSGKPYNDVELTTASMKKGRPYLVASLYGAFPNQCTTCGRRFASTAEGKQKKERHMDWHFKVKDPELVKHAIHRSWYISEREWIDYREPDEEALLDPSKTKTAAAPTKKDPRDRYVHVPSDPQLANAPCPICQEKFEPQFSYEANDFVWKDALKVNGKIYHATCWEEYSGGTGGKAGGRGTPDSVLGKRKAEGIDSVDGPRVKVKS